MGSEYEEQITKAIAKTFHFDYQPNKNQVKCQECGKRFELNRIGAVNEKMIQHFDLYHKPVYK